MKDGFRRQAETGLVAVLKKRLGDVSIKRGERDELGEQGAEGMEKDMKTNRRPWPLSIFSKDADAPSSGAKAPKKGAVREIIEAIAIAIALALVIRAFIIQPFKIPSSSMEDTLLIGDHLFVNKFAYGVQVPRPAMVEVFDMKVPFIDTWLLNAWGEIRHGDIIVFRFPDDRYKDFIKRVVGLPGDKVEIRDKAIYVNDVKWDESFGVYKGGAFGEPVAKSLNFGPITVPPDRVFVMGDNRDRSYDSRFWGTVPIEDIKGKAFILYWSWDSNAHTSRFGRIGKILH